MALLKLGANIEKLAECHFLFSRAGDQAKTPTRDKPELVLGAIRPFLGA
jgi:hypothetical protein